MNKLLPLTMFFLLAYPAYTQYFSSLERLNSAINTDRYDEIRPVVSPDGNQLFFTREAYPIFNRTLIESHTNLHETLSEASYLAHLSNIYSSLGQRIVEDPVASSFNQDIWVANSVDEDFDEVTHPHYPLNNAFPNSICAFNAQENSAIVVNQFPVEGGIRPGFSLVKRYSKERWSSPTPITIKGFSTDSPDVNLALSEDGEILILSIQDKTSYGKSNDLYISFRISEVEWSKPQHLGPAINSAYHETAPFLSEDKKTLFFASNRRGGSGGSDIYFVQRLGDSWTRWTAPKRFLSPVNSSADDSHPFFHQQSGYLYFSSRRGGSSDIYRLKIAMPHSNEVAVSGKILVSNSPEKVKAVIYSSPSKSTFFRQVYESTDGNYRIRIPKGEAYEIKAQRPGYIGRPESVAFNTKHVFFKDHKLNLLMDPLESGRLIHLKNIYFQRTKAIILEGSLPALNHLADIMVQNPGLYIQIEGHTDNLGDKHALQRLSEDRSKAIRSFLTNQKGIDPARITCIGFGDAFPINDNSTEALRQANRRVDIKIDRYETTTALEK